MLRNVGSNWVLLMIGIASTYFMTPFIIRTLGNEGYGTWTLLTAIGSYISLLNLGVPMACVRFIAQRLVLKDDGQVNAIIGSCAGLYLMVGAAALVLAGGLAAVLDQFTIPANLEAQAYLAFAVMALQVSAGFVGLLPEGIMLAHHDFVLRNTIKIGGVLLRLGLTIGLLTLTPSLVVLAFVQLAALAFDAGVGGYLITRRYPGLRISLADFDWRIVRQIVSFSLYVLLLAGGTRLVFETDALVIGAVLGVGVIPYYAVANSLVVYVMDFIISIAAVVSPMATRLHAEDRMDELRAMFLKWSKVALTISITATLFLAVLGPRFIGWWIDPSYEQPSGLVLQILMISGVAFLPIRGVAQPILVGIGRPEIPAYGFIATGILNVALSLALARPFGLAGVAIGTAVPNALFAVIVAVVTCRDLQIGFWQYVGYVVPRAMVGALPVLALLLWFRIGLDVNGLFGLAAAGVAALIASGIVWVAFVYHRDPFINLTPHLARLRAWSRA